MNNYRNNHLFTNFLSFVKKTAYEICINYQYNYVIAMNIAHSEILQWKMGVCYKKNIKKMEECVHRTQMPPDSSESKQGHNSKMEKVVKSQIERQHSSISAISCCAFLLWYLNA
jgi:hypothetical protein